MPSFKHFCTFTELINGLLFNFPGKISVSNAVRIINMNLGKIVANTYCWQGRTEILKIIGRR